MYGCVGSGGGGERGAGFILIGDLTHGDQSAAGDRNPSSKGSVGLPGEEGTEDTEGAEMCLIRPQMQSSMS